MEGHKEQEAAGQASEDQDAAVANLSGILRSLSRLVWKLLRILVTNFHR